MVLLSPPSSALVPATPAASGPVCSLQRSGSLWQLGIEAQELTTAIGQLAEQLEADDDDTRSQALAELEAALLAEEGNNAALAAKADATCWVIEHLRGQAAYRQQQAKRLTELSRSDASRARNPAVFIPERPGTIHRSQRFGDMGPGVRRRLLAPAVRALGTDHSCGPFHKRPAIVGVRLDPPAPLLAAQVAPLL
jgi:hypothetical protein